MTLLFLALFFIGLYVFLMYIATFLAIGIGAAIMFIPAYLVCCIIPFNFYIVWAILTVILLMTSK